MGLNEQVPDAGSENARSWLQSSGQGSVAEDWNKLLSCSLTVMGSLGTNDLVLSFLVCNMGIIPTMRAAVRLNPFLESTWHAAWQVLATTQEFKEESPIQTLWNVQDALSTRIPLTGINLSHVPC